MHRLAVTGLTNRSTHFPCPLCVTGRKQSQPGHAAVRHSLPTWAQPARLSIRNQRHVPPWLLCLWYAIQYAIRCLLTLGAVAMNWQRDGAEPLQPRAKIAPLTTDWVSLGTAEAVPLSASSTLASRKACTSLWWPRRPLATLGRKSRQGRKAATVSTDAGAEVSWRGHRPFRAAPGTAQDFAAQNLGSRSAPPIPAPSARPLTKGACIDAPAKRVKTS